MLMNRLLVFVFLSLTASADCIPFTDAPQHLGESRCVKGKVVNIGESRGGQRTAQNNEQAVHKSGVNLQVNSASV